ncbi:uncharacterized protein [Argopecten irradians]|uniref:uncharacterized protein isoform X2 n=1 Tax=Argopecten irradians TaxID=31199 RepID=UPI003719FDC2
MLGRREERRLGRIGRLPLVTPLSPINRLVSRRQLRLLRRGRLLGIGRIGSPINLPGCTCRTTSRCFFRRTGVPCFNRFTGTLGTNCCPFPLIFPG